MERSVENGWTLSDLRDSWSRYADDLLLHDPGGPAECLVRKGEIVTARSRLDPVLGRLRRWVDRVRYDDDLELARVRLRNEEQDRCVEIAADTADAVVNHVHLGSTVMFGTPVMFGTGSGAEPAPLSTEPPERRWEPAVAVGILDTGLDPHPWFRDRAWYERVPEVLDADDDRDQDRQAGHGTFVAGVVLGNAPGATIRAHRALSSLGFTDDLTVASGLRSLRRAAGRRGERVGTVLLTAGCHTADDACPPVLRDEIARDPDVKVVAAAGNHATDRPFWPAALPDVLAVAATGADGRRADFSNHGPWVDAAAPGVDVVSSYVRLAQRGRGRTYGFASWSGTSFAAPRLAAEVASALHAGHETADATSIACQKYPFEG
ncbi:S8 family peptidase [Parasphingorhabdus pacifica]